MMGRMMVCDVHEDTDLLSDGLCIITLFDIDNTVDGANTILPSYKTYCTAVHSRNYFAFL